MSDYDDIRAMVADYYAAKLGAHGPTPRGVDWNTEQSQTQRHRQFLRLLGEEREASVLDLGCGYGDFLAFLRRHGFVGDYIGYDITPQMIAEARRIHGETDEQRWRVGAIPDETSDYVIASGVFNVKRDVPTEQWRLYIRDTIELLARIARRGIAFNVLTLSSDPAFRRSDLYYADPTEMLEYCLSRFGRSVALLQDYGLWEFTAVIRLASYETG